MCDLLSCKITVSWRLRKEKTRTWTNEKTQSGGNTFWLLTFHWWAPPSLLPAQPTILPPQPPFASLSASCHFWSWYLIGKISEALCSPNCFQRWRLLICEGCFWLEEVRCCLPRYKSLLDALFCFGDTLAVRCQRVLPWDFPQSSASAHSPQIPSGKNLFLAAELQRPLSVYISGKMFSFFGRWAATPPTSAELTWAGIYI